MDRFKAVFVVGTRPDAIKTAPVVQEFLKYKDRIETVLVSTGQHREMLDQALHAFGLRPQHELGVMRHGQSLAEITSRVLEGLDSVYAGEAPQIVFAQGDTTTTFVAGLAAFYRQVPFAHIEAGLRTMSVHDPFPEEFNRRAVGLFARLHFAPTRWAADNLLTEGRDAASVFVTGNTGIDAVTFIASGQGTHWYPDHDGRVLLLTTHRRENWGEPQRRIAEAARELTQKYEDLLLVVPLHKNPVVRETLAGVLRGVPRVEMIEPPDYVDFVHLLKRSTLALTDSGGVQEEAPTFGVPVLVLRDTTERPEGVEVGAAKLVGTDRARIVAEASRLLESGTEYQAMAKVGSPYGDGKASQRIRLETLRTFGIDSPEEPMWT